MNSTMKVDKPIKQSLIVAAIWRKAFWKLGKKNHEVTMFNVDRDESQDYWKVLKARLYTFRVFVALQKQCVEPNCTKAEKYVLRQISGCFNPSFPLELFYHTQRARRPARYICIMYINQGWAGCRVSGQIILHTLPGIAGYPALFCRITGYPAE